MLQHMAMKWLANPASGMRMLKRERAKYSKTLKRSTHTSPTLFGGHRSSARYCVIHELRILYKSQSDSLSPIIHAGHDFIACGQVVPSLMTQIGKRLKLTKMKIVTRFCPRSPHMGNIASGLKLRPSVVLDLG